MSPIKRSLLAVAFIVFLAASAAWFFSVHETPSLTRASNIDALEGPELGAAEFEGASFGGISMTALETHAVPWRLVAAALILDEKADNPDAEVSRETLNSILARFGFLVGATPVNRPSIITPSESVLPLGFTYGDLAPIGGANVFVANLGCAACHAGVTYDENGRPQPDRAWLGMPNTSINLEAYVTSVFEALVRQADNTETFLATVGDLFPELHVSEALTLRFFVLPIVKDRLAELSEARAPLPFPNGVPGSTNGVAALKWAFGTPLLEGGPNDNGIVSIPDLGHRSWRTSLLADSAYAPTGKPRQRQIRKSDISEGHLSDLAAITTFFTVPSMGVDSGTAIHHLDKATAIFDFIENAYAPQAFPGTIDSVAAQRGARIYNENCSECHGTYEWQGERPVLALFPNWLGDVGTDPLRARTFTQDLADAIGETSHKNVLSAVSTGKYAAPPLTGAWASAPYLHNGSVPTITALLSPDLRPTRFQVGGHSLDFQNLGIALRNGGGFPEDYKPFSEPVWFDTSITGHGNDGHEFGSELSDDEKRDLIEFLKLL
ncbi:MAG: cytochrome c [Pseudomonadota bacterium]